MGHPLDPARVTPEKLKAYYDSLGMEANVNVSETDLVAGLDVQCEGLNRPKRKAEKGSSEARERMAEVRAAKGKTQEKA